jgi:hypothetical protein
MRNTAIVAMLFLCALPNVGMGDGGICGGSDSRASQLKQPLRTQLKTCVGQDRSAWHNCIGTANVVAQDHSATWTGRFMNGKEDGEFRTSERFMGQEILNCTKRYANGFVDGWSDCIETINGQTKSIRTFYLNGARMEKAEGAMSNHQEYFVYGLIAPRSGRQMEIILARFGVKVVYRGCNIGSEQYADEMKSNRRLIDSLPPDVQKEFGLGQNKKMIKTP